MYRPYEDPRLPAGTDPGPWGRDAACLTADPDLFFPARGDWEASRQARRICAGCPVLVPCREHGLAHESEGIWGGLTARQRQELRQDAA